MIDFALIWNVVICVCQIKNTWIIYTTDKITLEIVLILSFVEIHSRFLKTISTYLSNSWRDLFCCKSITFIFIKSFCTIFEICILFRVKDKATTLCLIQLNFLPIPNYMSSIFSSSHWSFLSNSDSKIIFITFNCLWIRFLLISLRLSAVHVLRIFDWSISLTLHVSHLTIIIQ